MKAYTLFLLAFLMGLVLCNAADDSHYPLLLRQRREAQGPEKPSIRKAILDMVSKLRGAAKQVINSLKDFANDMIELIPSFQSKLISNVAKIRERVTAIKLSVTDRLYAAGGGALDCVNDFSQKAESVLNSTVTNTISCADNRLADISNLISSLTKRAQLAIDTADDAVKKMKNCTNSDGVFNIGACMGSVALQADLKTVSFITESSISLARINMAVATLSAALEVCTGKYLVDAGIATAGFAVDIGKCSADTAMSALAGGTDDPDSLESDDDEASKS